MTSVPGRSSALTAGVGGGREDWFEPAAGVVGPVDAGVVAPGVTTMGDGTCDMKLMGDSTRALEGARLVAAGPAATPRVFERDDRGGWGIVELMSFNAHRDWF